MSKTVIAGKDSCGSSSDMLCMPWRIFVTIKFDLYVADFDKHIIQLFESGQLTGKTVVGGQETLNMRFFRPISVVVDAGNNRIIRSNSNAFYCVAGCSTVTGSASNQLDSPFIAAFHNVGNILVADSYNRRVQKFVLTTHTDGKCFKS